jgi:hypothetical protein
MNNLIDIYQDDSKKTRTIISLVGLGAGVFYRAYVIENLGNLIDFLTEHERKPKNQHEIWKFLEPFVWDRLVDDVRIMICFENTVSS